MFYLVSSAAYQAASLICRSERHQLLTVRVLLRRYPRLVSRSWISATKIRPSICAPTRTVRPKRSRPSAHNICPVRVLEQPELRTYPGIKVEQVVAAIATIEPVIKIARLKNPPSRNGK